jgi:hypothetical protein
MKTEDFEAFKEGMIGVMSFYSKGISNFALDVWWSALKTYDLPVIIEAFNRHLCNPDAGQYPPKPADLVKLLAGSTQDRALRAWAKVDRAVRQVGNYESVVFDDPLIHRTLHDMGGWIALGQKTEDEWPFVAKEFENRYRGFSQRSELPEYPCLLLGIAEAYNQSQGNRSSPPRLIGHEGAARKVRDGGTDSPLISMRSAGEVSRESVLRLVPTGPAEEAA